MPGLYTVGPSPCSWKTVCEALNNTVRYQLGLLKVAIFTALCGFSRCALMVFRGWLIRYSTTTSSSVTPREYRYPNFTITHKAISSRPSRPVVKTTCWCCCIPLLVARCRQTQKLVDVIATSEKARRQTSWVQNNREIARSILGNSGYFSVGKISWRHRVQRCDQYRVVHIVSVCLDFGGLSTFLVVAWFGAVRLLPRLLRVV